MSRKARPLPTPPPVCDPSLEFYIQYLAWGLGGGGRQGGPGFCPPSFLGSQSRRYREMHSGTQGLRQVLATEVRGKLRGRQKARSIRRVTGGVEAGGVLCTN